MPNAGKSTLLSRLSRATPQIADYPFTTKSPNLGLVTLGGDSTLVLADLPGLIEGASQGVGLGHEFLRHVERTRVLVHLLEPFPLDGTTPLGNYHAIRNELKLYSEALAEKPEIVCLSKSELTGAADILRELETELCREVLLISSVTGAGLAPLVGQITQQLVLAKRREARAKPVRAEFAPATAVADEAVPEPAPEAAPVPAP